MTAQADGAGSRDTIVARATALGTAALGVVRMSGPVAQTVAGGLIRPAALPDAGTHGVRWVHTASGQRLDQAVVSVFAGPASYTGEDVVEFSLHGNPLTLDAVVAACVTAGARRAEPGEFTRRAYLNGKLDLLQAEAVIDVVEGSSPALRSAALQQLDRGLSMRLSGLRASLVELEALLTHHIDFPDEDEPPVPMERILERAGEVEAELAHLVATAPEGELLREGALTVLAGPPNSGKSSLFNALLGRERAIVTEVPGTTRDAIEAGVSLHGFPFVLVDTAGLRDSSDRVERIGIEVAQGYLDRANLVLLCATDPARLEELDAALELPADRRILVHTQIDREPAQDAAARRPATSNEQDAAKTAAVPVSAVTGAGLDQLRARMADAAFGTLRGAGPEQSIVTRRRHTEALQQAASELREFAEGLRQQVPAEVAAVHLRPAASALEELLGVISHDEVLDRVFRDFCIGK